MQRLGINMNLLNKWLPLKVLDDFNAKLLEPTLQSLMYGPLINSNNHSVFDLRPDHAAARAPVLAVDIFIHTRCVGSDTMKSIPPLV